MGGCVQSANKDSVYLLKFKKEGLPLDEVATFSGLAHDEVVTILANASGLDVQQVERISNLIEEGMHHSTISQDLGIDLNVLSRFFPSFIIPQSKQAEIINRAKQGLQNDQIAGELHIKKENLVNFLIKTPIKLRNAPGSLVSTVPMSVAINRPKVCPEEFIEPSEMIDISGRQRIETKSDKGKRKTPSIRQTIETRRKNLYSIKSNKLYTINMSSCTHSFKKVGLNYFNEQSVCTEVQGYLGLFVTGGLNPETKEPTHDLLIVNGITFETAKGPQMVNAHAGHSAIYFEGFLYVVGKTKCERLDVTNNTWSPMPDLPCGTLTTGLVASKAKDCLYICRSNSSETG
mmetsp:Transcript_20148/g.37478  ORF Transcript_20148/g.37478 Transcript_20148/m.37478 type:complete len:346 (+) Transcript_20148:12-1049(+)